MTGDNRATFRLAFREEGDNVNVYMAPLDTMEGAVFIASFNRQLLVDCPDLFESYKSIVQRGMGEMLKNVFGAESVDWDERVASDKDRSGNA